MRTNQQLLVSGFAYQAINELYRLNENNEELPLMGFIVVCKLLYILRKLGLQAQHMLLDLRLSHVVTNCGVGYLPLNLKAGQI
ncbi:hypothetical protein FHG08_11565 [Pseudoalteromonas sp. Scap03]|uniref:hypothetical protein n=1 Tax=unclassified Pseudoalteromonas TaxID=194690 RepID=UPI0015BAD22E|nr:MULTISPECIES: hypothetical protein [unclassified Pseudoalteromonas]NWL16329.1 hypothetical protein [Pseudoalteromonas sp. Scap03]QLE81447.1 hypothetical protein FLM54_07820 [Pseudoalteromonas sp. Scap25]QLE89391.1 hypothetical protein FLM47_07815 [Pseudoalteromonas sp. Scap06]